MRGSRGSSPKVNWRRHGPAVGRRLLVTGRSLSGGRLQQGDAESRSTARASRHPHAVRLKRTPATRVTLAAGEGTRRGGRPGSGAAVVDDHPLSVESGDTLEEIVAAPERVRESSAGNTEADPLPRARACARKYRWRLTGRPQRTALRPIPAGAGERCDEGACWRPVATRDQV